MERAEFADRAWNWPGTYGLLSIDDLTEKSPRKLGAKEIRNPPVWQVLGHPTATIDSVDHPCIWDPIYDDGHRLVLREPIWRAIAAWDAKACGGRLKVRAFCLPTAWKGVAVPRGGWRVP